MHQAIINLDAAPAPAGSMTVVLGSGWPGILLHEAVGHGLEGDFNRKGSSIFSGRIGERVAAKGVTVVDDGTEQFDGTVRAVVVNPNIGQAWSTKRLHTWLKIGLHPAPAPPSSSSTWPRRSLPQNISSPTKKVGMPPPPRDGHLSVGGEFGLHFGVLGGHK